MFEQAEQQLRVDHANQAVGALQEKTEAATSQTAAAHKEIEELNYQISCMKDALVRNASIWACRDCCV